MTVRTTVAFDPATAARPERLAKRWGVSKSETMRRAFEQAEQAAATTSPETHDFTGMSPIEILDWLEKNPSPPVPGGWGDDPHRELREMRELDARIEEEREHERVAKRMRQADEEVVRSGSKDWLASASSTINVYDPLSPNHRS